MKSLIKISLVALTLMAGKIQAQEQVNQFNQKLDTLYAQSNAHTLPQQVVYGVVEGYLAYKLNSLIPKPDRLAVQNIQAQITLLNSSHEPNLTPQQRAQKREALKRQLRKIEGGVITKLGRGAAKIIIRGTQAFLVVDLATRIYIVNLTNKDPSFFPAYTLLCSDVDCDVAIQEVLYIQSEAYKRAVRNLP